MLVGVGASFDVGIIMWLYWNGQCARYMGVLPSTVGVSLNPANGVTLNAASKTVTWLNGGASITGLVCSGGVMPVTDVGMQVTVGCGGLPILGVDPMQVISGPPTMAANSPVTLVTTLAGVPGIWEDIVLTNAAMGSFLKWTAAIIGLNPGNIVLGKTAYTGLGLQGSENISLSLSSIPAIGAYTALVRFTDSEGVLPDVDVTVNLTVVPNYTGTITMVHSWVQSPGGAHGGPTTAAAAYYVGPPVYWSTGSGSSSIVPLFSYNYDAGHPGWWMYARTDNMPNEWFWFQCGTVSLDPVTGKPTGTAIGYWVFVYSGTTYTNTVTVVFS
jgi:hypothetical protein